MLPSLHRLMRTLAGLGILTKSLEQRFALTDLGHALRSDRPNSARAAVMYFAGPPTQSGWDQLLHSVRAQRHRFCQGAPGCRSLDYLAKHPEDASRFSEAMVDLHGPGAAAVAAA